MTGRLISCLIRGLPGIALVFGLSAQAAQLLDNGNFERGDLSAWQNLSSGKASAQIVRRGNCFADLDTREINIRGKFAAMLRSPGKSADKAVLRSAAFTAGEGFAFIALRGSSIQSADNTKTPNNAIDEFQVDILDAQSNRSLISLPLQPVLLKLETECPGAARIGQFSSHYISTRAYAGQSIKIQFTQRSPAHSSNFSLIDQVVQFSSDEQLLFYARPVAQAGVSISAAGTPYLDSTGSFHPATPQTPLSYIWALEQRRYDSAKPCLNDLPAGNYRAILYVSDSQHAISDDTRLYIGAAENSAMQRPDPQCDSIAQPVKTAAQQPAMDGNKSPGQSVAQQAVSRALQDWQQAWSSRKANRYIDAYITDYAPAGKSHASWIADRRWNFKTRQYIKVEISNIEITQSETQIRATFDQAYQSNTYQGQVKRELIFVEQDGDWKIKSELNAE